MPPPVSIRASASRGAAAGTKVSEQGARLRASEDGAKSVLTKRKGRLAVRHSVQRSGALERQQRYESLALAVGGLILMLFLIIFMIWTRRRRLRELGRLSSPEVPSGSFFSGVQADEEGHGGRRLIQLLSTLKNPGLIFLFFFLLHKLLPYISFGHLGGESSSWLRLIVVVTGIYVLAESLFIIVVDYFLISIQGVELPRIFYQIIKILAFVLIYLPVLSTQFGLDITPLLTTSAVLTMVIGLALQDSLGNLFSGIAMQISNPFKVGDWVLVAGREGRVTEVNWRATTIKTFSNDYLIIPNHNISKAEIQNYSRPTKVHARFLNIGLAYEDSPEQVEEVLVSATLSVDGVLPRPKPRVMIRGFNDFTIDYVVKFFILDYAKFLIVESAIRKRLWYALKSAGMTIPFPIRTIERKQKPDLEQENYERVKLLSKIDFLQAISDTGLHDLAASFRKGLYPSDFDIVSKGEKGESFYVIRRGRAKVIVEDEDSGEEVLLANLEEGSFFGEMSLLTGQCRSATVRTLEEVETLTLDKDSFKSILHREPKLAERISEIIVSRRESTQTKLAKSDERVVPGSVGSMSKDEQKREQQNLLNKIILFFGI